MADKSNAMTHGHALWQRVFREVAAEFPTIKPTHMYIDALAMYLVKDPAQFQVIVTNNLFGDIVTDLGGALQGGLGMAASGNIHPGQTSLFEPVHGSAPPLAGKNIANPIGAILSAALMLETVGWTDEAKRIEAAVESAVRGRQTTKDIGGTLGTREAGDWIANESALAPGPSVAERAAGREPGLTPSVVRSDRLIKGQRSVYSGRRPNADDRIHRRAEGRLGARAGRDCGARRRSSERACKPEWIEHAVFGNVHADERATRSTARATSR